MQVKTLTLAVMFGCAAAGAEAGDDLVRASGPSPFGPLEECGNFPGALGSPGVNYVNSEVEPWVVTNPQNEKNVVAFWQQDRWSNGGARSNVVGVSKDGGATWTEVIPPLSTDCSDGGTFERASDPWLSFSPNGVLHQMSLVFSETEETRNGMIVSRSEDGGLTWSAPTLLAEDTESGVLNDKNTITADPTDSDYVYAVWGRLVGINLGQTFEGGPLQFARSTDNGQTWEPTREIFNPGQGNQILAVQIAVLPDGKLLAFFNDIDNADVFGEERGRFTLAYISSDDKGETWSSSEVSEAIAPIETVGTFTPDSGDLVRAASRLFDVAVDPQRGTLYAVWQDARFSDSEIDEIAYSESRDGGQSWSEPVKINKTPDNEDTVLREQAFIPSVEVASDGTVGVTYYDFRNDVDGGQELADHFFVSCGRDCTDPDNWEEKRLTGESFDYALAPTARGRFLGDYVGLSTARKAFDAFFQQTESRDDRASGFATRPR